MTNKVLSTSFKSKLGVDILHRALVDVKTCTLLKNTRRHLISNGRTLMSSRILLLPVLQVLEKVPRPPLFKQTHQRTFHSLHLGTRHFRDFSISVDIGTGDDLEFEVTRDVSMDEHSGELARGEDEFRDEVDSVVAVAA